MKQYKEGIDYYMEGERVIFTALAHINRGECCGNGCRHCPYSPKHTRKNVVLAEKLLKFNSNKENGSR